MIIYSLFPLFAFLCNVIIGTYVLYRNPRDRMNILFALFTFALGAWGAGDFLVFVSLSEASALLSDKISTAASIMGPAFLLHFFLFFTSSGLASGKRVYILYLPAAFLLPVGMFTRLISSSAEVSYWGYNILEGSLYAPAVAYIVLYVIIGLFVSYRFHSSSESKKKRKQAILLSISILIILVGGVVSEGILPLLGIQIMPLTSTLSVITGAIIAYTIMKYRLMVPFSFSIRGKLVTVFLIILVSFLIILLFTVNTFSRDMAETRAADNLKGVTEQKLNWIDSYLSERKSDSAILSRSPSVRRTLKEGIPSDADEYIRDFAESYGYYDVFLVTPEGDVIWSLKDEVDENLDHGEFSDTNFAELYRRLMNSSGSLVSDYEIHVHTGEPSLYIGSPVISDGKLAGEIILQMELEHLNGIMRDSSGLGETGETYLVGRDHYLRSDLRFEGKVILVKRIDTENVEVCFREEQEEFRKPEVLENYENTLVLETHFYMEDYDLCMIAEITEEEILRPTYNMMSMILVLFVIILAAAFTATFLTARSITNPILRLKNMVEKIGKGNLETRVDVKSNDEVGELARGIEQMSKYLRESQKEIKRHARKLEEKVRKRTDDLNSKVKEMYDTKTAILNMMEDMDEANTELVNIQEELRNSLSELKEMDNRKNQFISIAAHELKTPLTSIHGFSQLLLDKKIADDIKKRKKYLSIMNTETKRLAKLVGDILDLSRIDLGTVKLNIERIKMNEIIESVRREMAIQIKIKGLKSDFDVQENIPEIKTDRERVTQILLNLINNAVKYTPEGKISFKAYYDRKKIHFIIRDTGVGISKDNQEKIFERFYQVDSSYTRKVGGTGLGLSLVKEFLDMLGGKITLKSQEGKGTEFHVTLPRKPDFSGELRKEEKRARENLAKSEETSKKIKMMGI